MALFVVRSTHVESLVGELCKLLVKQQTADPFATVPIVVGSRFMDRWLRHQIATETQVCAGVAFPLVKPALEGAARWIEAGCPQGAHFWEPDADDTAQLWEADHLAFRLIPALRKLAGESGFEDVTAYLAAEDARAVAGEDGPKTITHRELAFAGQLAEVVARLAYERSDETLAWAKEPNKVPLPHHWLARLLKELELATSENPATRYRTLKARKAARLASTAPLMLFGVSTLSAGERVRIAALSRVLDVHLFTMSATVPKPRGSEPAHANPVLASLGAASAEFTRWLAEEGATVRDLPGLTLDDAGNGLLHRVQAWIRENGAATPGALSTTGHDPSLSFHAEFGPLRQVEVLRDELLALFAKDKHLEPRDVLVLTPALDVYAPLVAAVFAQQPLAEPETVDATAAETTAQAGKTGRKPKDKTAAGKRTAEAPEPPSVAVGEQTKTPARPRVPAIPVAIGDLGLRRTSPVAETLCAMLNLCVERVTAPLLLEFISLEPVRRRLDVQVEELGEIRTLIGDSGMRWGLDAMDRQRVEQPALDGNTLRFGVERLALGVLMHDELPLGVVTGPVEGFTSLAPLGVENPDHARLVGAIAAAVRGIAWLRGEVGDGRTRAYPTAQAWGGLLHEVMEDFAPTSDASAWQRGAVREVIDLLGEERPAPGNAARALAAIPIEPRALLRWLEGRFELPATGERQIKSAVTVTALQPLRSVPYRVIALLGMDDDSFPRSRSMPTWDPFAQSSDDRRAMDRQLLLETLLSARTHLMVYWAGRDPHSGAAVPAAVPIEELLDVLRTVTSRERWQLVSNAHLQPWSSGLFGATPLSFDHSMAQAASVVVRLRDGTQEPEAIGLAASGTAKLAEEPRDRPLELELSELANGLVQPARMLLKDRLRLSLREQDRTLEEREPLELDTLDTWKLDDRLINALVAAETDTPGVLPTAVQLTGPLLARLRGEGTLPLEAGGEAELELSAKRVVSALEVAQKTGALVESPSLTVLISGAQLFGIPRRTRRTTDGLRVFEWLTPSAADKPGPLLVAYIYVLAAEAMTGERTMAQVVSTKNGAIAKLQGPGTAELAKSELESLVAVWKRARLGPLPLFAKTSKTLAEGLPQPGESRAGGPSVGLKEKLRSKWYGTSEYTYPECNDVWIRPFFPDFDPGDALDDFETPRQGSFVWLAEAVWGSVQRAGARAAQPQGDAETPGAASKGDGA